MRNKAKNESGSSANAAEFLSDVCCGGGSFLPPPDYGASFPCSALGLSTVLAQCAMQRSSSLHPSPRSSGNLIFWKHFRGEVSILEVTVALEPPFHSTPLGKYVFSFPFFGKHSLPILTPLLLFSASSSPPSHMSTHFLVSSLSPYQKNQTVREAQKLPRVPSLISWRNSCPFSTDPEYEVLPWPMGMEVAVPFVSQTCHGTGLRD